MPEVRISEICIRIRNQKAPIFKGQLISLEKMENFAANIFKKGPLLQKFRGILFKLENAAIANVLRLKAARRRDFCRSGLF